MPGKQHKIAITEEADRELREALIHAHGPQGLARGRLQEEASKAILNHAHGLKAKGRDASPQPPSSPSTRA